MRSKLPPTLALALLAALSTPALAVTPDPCAPGAIVLCLTLGEVVEDGLLVDPRPSSWLGPRHDVALVLQTYVFENPVGGDVLLQCVDVARDGAVASACADAGGSPEGAGVGLVAAAVHEPPMPRIRVCEARLTATAAGYGVQDATVRVAC